MNKPVAVLDLDDTLIDLKTTLMDGLNFHYGYNLHWSEWVLGQVQNYYGISHSEFQDVVIERMQLFKDIKPLPHARDFLRDLRVHNFHIAIVTARDGFIPNAYEKTKEYLEKYDLMYDELITTKGGQKVDKTRHLGTIEFVLDDSETNCLQFAECDFVKNVFLVDTPWNKKLKGVERIYTLYQVFHKLGISW